MGAGAACRGALLRRGYRSRIERVEGRREPGGVCGSSVLEGATACAKPRGFEHAEMLTAQCTPVGLCGEDAGGTEGRGGM